MQIHSSFRLELRAATLIALAALMTACLAPLGSSQQAASSQQTPPVDLVIKNATVMTASHGTIEHGSVWVQGGKIGGVGATVSAPAGAVIVDATGLWLTPGIIDPHSHSALDGDVNEGTSPVAPSMHMIEAFY